MKMSDFYKFRGGILRICGRLVQTHAKIIANLVHGASVLLRLAWGVVYLGVSRKFSLNLQDLRSNLKVAYRPLLALPSRWLRRCRARRCRDRVARAVRRGYPLRARFASAEIKISTESA